MRITVSLIFLFASLGSNAVEPLHAEHGMVVSASREASEAGVAMLRAGGNVVDAAVATGFALAVTFPEAGNLGGGGFLVAVFADGREIALDFREMAPAAAKRTTFLDAHGDVVEGLSLRSPLASGVPGSVAGLLRAWADYASGAITREELLAPAIALAEDGFAITATFAQALNKRRAFFERDAAAAKVFVRRDDAPWRDGDVLRQPDLAATLRRIARDGADGFYAGKTADLLAALMARTGGLITRADLAAYKPVYREPVVGSFRDYRIVSMPPPSSGGVLLLQMLNMLDTLPFDGLAHNSAPYVHLLTEVARRAYADRAMHLGDPDFWPVPVEMLTDPEYALARAADISSDRATPSGEVAAGKAAVISESLETTHYSVADAAGNAVAVSTTLNASYGSGILVEGAGFFLNNEMDDFSLKPGVPNLYGLVGGEANAVAPGKRMLSSMTPTIAVRAGKPALVLGSPGGSTIITTVLQVFLNVASHGMDIGDAVAAPRVHHQWLPDRIVYEDGALNTATVEHLQAMGHDLQETDKIGQANCLSVEDGRVHGAPDSRGENAAVGF